MIFFLQIITKISDNSREIRFRFDFNTRVGSDPFDESMINP